jgi:hypothetical protein
MNAKKQQAIRLIESALVILKAGGEGSEILLRSALDELSLSTPSTPTKTGYAPRTEVPERPVKSAVKPPTQNEKVPKMVPTISCEELTAEMRDYVGRIIDFLLTRDEMKDMYVIICGSVSARQFEIDGKPMKSSELLNRIIASELTFSSGNKRYKIQKILFDDNHSHNGYGLVDVDA